MERNRTNKGASYGETSGTLGKTDREGISSLLISVL